VKVFKTRENIRKALNQLKSENVQIGFVPTMGALHEGHLSLVRTGFLDNAIMVVSIFVNPTQFDKKEDLIKYPRTLERDVELLETVSDGEIMVYAPPVKDIYENKINAQSFSFGGIESEMEGKYRTGHFNGVATVVKRLINIIEPHNAYFGEKDFQQLQIIRKLVLLENLTVNIIGCKIYRESNGLAMSSRNERLEAKYKREAPFIYKTLKLAKAEFKFKSAAKVSKWVENQFANNALLDLEYFIIADTDTLKPLKRKTKNKKYRAFIAAYAGGIRLIDNIALN